MFRMRGAWASNVARCNNGKHGERDERASGVQARRVNGPDAPSTTSGPDATSEQRKRPRRGEWYEASNASGANSPVAPSTASGEHCELRERTKQRSRIGTREVREQGRCTPCLTRRGSTIGGGAGRENCGRFFAHHAWIPRILVSSSTRTTRNGPVKNRGDKSALDAGGDGTSAGLNGED
ncbi:hypothetical protein K488DRAFT_72475 [Vararia minispora EC-137]|uniref:Uncharacterized protein n=1 Tax=Vararia minispora EC-137 TaxID=1314806 RepID=A0ACB8QE79_9AGAM|nr:hypothetical protein K488DRAFT_72475 [Vararia minispora EC-137]